MDIAALRRTHAFRASVEMPPRLLRIIIRAACCARVAKGHVAAARAISGINSRLLIAPLKAEDQPSYRLKPAYWKGPRSALGQSLQILCRRAGREIRFDPNRPDSST